MTILPGSPWLIVHRSMLGINKPYKVSLNGQDYVLWQNPQGDVFALVNICPHMQAPLSEGWICHKQNAITCPFHALKFDGQGRLHQPEKTGTQALTAPLALTIRDDCVWTYGGESAKIPVPNLIEKLSLGMTFLGVAGEKSIRGTLLDALLISYDYNHLIGTHREFFGTKASRISAFEQEGYWAKVEQEVDRHRVAFNDIRRNPSMLLVPKTSTGTLEYAFPALLTFRTRFLLGEILQVHVLYPETETRTKTFVLVYAKFNHSVFKPLLQQSILSAVATVVEQDTRTIETLYPRELAKIRLPNEEIMFHAEKLYHEW
ncbi:MAG: Rieske 2Fe-2S domain-containing protein [Leptolyngbyaceae cyanobacterium bins.302]|nr:Rieske 2Fe-2S domain-containing protein [Leptolyngbyaceae cyanobacterium bins.302]